MLPARTRIRVTRRLIPYLIFIYILAYLDRANVGVAKLQMQSAMNFSDAVIGFGAGIFFLGYLLLDIPGSLIVERWSARKWIARIMVSWGLVAALMGFLGMPVFDSFRPVTQFYSLRLLLGIAYEDYSIAAKAFRVATLRRFIDRVNVGSSYVLEICYLTHRTGGRVVQVPVSCEDWRASKFNLLHEAFYKYRHLLGLWLRYRRGVE